MAHTHTVLLVDDDPIFRTVVGGLPALAEARVLIAVDGRQAVRALASERDNIALIIIDLNMPNMNGVELLIELGNLGVRQPIVITSGAPPSTLRGAEALASASGLHLRKCLKKPVEMMALNRLVAECLQQPASA